MLPQDTEGPIVFVGGRDYAPVAVSDLTVSHGIGVERSCSYASQIQSSVPLGVT